MRRSVASIDINNRSNVLPPRYNQKFIFPEPDNPHHTTLTYRGEEFVAMGPAGTGKTDACLMRAHKNACLYPNSVGVFVRDTKESIKSTIIPSYYNILGYNPMNEPSFVKGYGGTRPDFFRYANGSEIYCLGMQEPKAFDSTQWDWIYVNQIEDLLEDEFEILTARCRGENMPYNTVFGCANPSVPDHWLAPENEKRRASVDYVETLHKHNPRYWRNGGYTEHGDRYVEKLQRMTGLRYQRYYLGLWVGAEGMVYDIPKETYTLKRGELPDIRDWIHYRVIDFGYVLEHPFVCLWIAKHPDKEYAVIHKEYRYTHRTVQEHIPVIEALSEGLNITETIADHDAEDRATLERGGIQTTAAKKAVRPGIDLTHEVLSNGKLKIYEGLRDGVRKDERMQESNKCVDSLFEEHAGYRYRPENKKTGNPKIDDVPYKQLGKDDACDCERYGVMEIFTDDAFELPVIIDTVNLW